MVGVTCGVSVDVSSMRSQLKSAISSKLVRNTTECHTRLLTYEFSLTLLPWRSPLLEAFDALELEATCGVERPVDNGTAAFPPRSKVPRAGYFVSPSGDDGAAGSLEAPFLTLQQAVKATREKGAVKSIALRGGTYFLGSTIALDERDSGLKITNFGHEEVWLSGGVPLSTSWEPVASIAGNVWVTDVTESFPERGTIVGLNVPAREGREGVRCWSFHLFCRRSDRACHDPRSHPTRP